MVDGYEFWDKSTFLHEAMGKYLLNEKGACLMGGAPALWGGTHYVVGYDVWAREIINTTTGTRTGGRKETTEYLKLVAPQMDPRAQPHLIACRNGVVDPFVEGFGGKDENGCSIGFYAPRREYPICNILPVDWNPDAYDEATDRWLDSYCIRDDGSYDEVKRVNLEETLALCIYRGQEVQQSVWLIGEGGNGKSLFQTALTAFVGEDNVSCVDIDEFDRSFTMVHTVGKLANIADDQIVSRLSAKACKRFKQAVVGSTVEVEEKFMSAFKVKPYNSFVFSLNKFPVLADTSLGMLDRIHAINFDRRFRGTSDQVPNMIKLLDTDTSRSYLLNLALKRLPALVGRGALTKTEFSESCRMEVMFDSDGLAAWLDDVDASSIVDKPVSDMYQKYVAFCDESKLGHVTPRAFTRRVNKATGFTSEKDGPRVNGQQLRMFRAAAA